MSFACRVHVVFMSFHFFDVIFMLLSCRLHVVFMSFHFFDVIFMLHANDMKVT